MYSWLWQHLPGSVAIRALTMTGLAMVVLAVCLSWAFPALADVLAPE
jgi:hypothetical protein